MNEKEKTFDLTRMSYGGVFIVECRSNNRAFFGGSQDEVWLSMQEFKNALIAGYCQFPEILNDLKNHGVDNFNFDVVVYGPEYRDTVRLVQKIKELQDNWKGGLYSPVS